MGVGGSGDTTEQREEETRFLEKFAHDGVRVQCVGLGRQYVILGVSDRKEERSLFVATECARAKQRNAIHSERRVKQTGM